MSNLSPTQRSFLARTINAATRAQGPDEHVGGSDTRPVDGPTSCLSPAQKVTILAKELGIEPGAMVDRCIALAIEAAEAPLGTTAGEVSHDELKVLLRSPDELPDISRMKEIRGAPNYLLGFLTQMNEAQTEHVAQAIRRAAVTSSDPKAVAETLKDGFENLSGTLQQACADGLISLGLDGVDAIADIVVRCPKDLSYTDAPVYQNLLKGLHDIAPKDWEKRVKKVVKNGSHKQYKILEGGVLDSASLDFLSKLVRSVSGSKFVLLCSSLSATTQPARMRELFFEEILKKAKKDCSDAAKLAQSVLRGQRLSTEEERALLDSALAKSSSKRVVDKLVPALGVVSTLGGFEFLMKCKKSHELEEATDAAIARNDHELLEQLNQSDVGEKLLEMSFRTSYWVPNKYHTDEVGIAKLEASRRAGAKLLSKLGQGSEIDKERLSKVYSMLLDKGVEYVRDQSRGTSWLNLDARTLARKSGYSIDQFPQVVAARALVELLARNGVRYDPDLQSKLDQIAALESPSSSRRTR